MLSAYVYWVEVVWICEYSLILDELWTLGIHIIIMAIASSSCVELIENSEYIVLFRAQYTLANFMIQVRYSMYPWEPITRLAIVSIATIAEHASDSRRVIQLPYIQVTASTVFPWILLKSIRGCQSLGQEADVACAAISQKHFLLG